MRKRQSFILISILLISLLPFGCKGKQPSLTYPVTEKGDVVDDYFGTKVADPYRWFEDENSEATAKWVQAENQVTFDYLAKIPVREKIRARLTEIYNYPRYSAPFRIGQYYFFSKNDGLQNQSVIYIQKGLDGEPRVFLDPNTLSPDGTTRAFLSGFSNDDRYAAYSRSEGGSDWTEMRVMEIETGKELDDHIQWTKFGGAAWQGDGFYYSGFEKPEEGKELTAANENQKIYYHKLGTPQTDDQLIYEDPAHPRRFHNLEVTEDEQFVFLMISEGTHGNELYCKDLKSKKPEFLPLVQGFEYDSYVINNLDDKLVIMTNMDAPNYKAMLVDTKKPARENWTVLLPEKPEVMTSASIVGGKIFASYLKDASTRIYQHDLAGNVEKEIPLPALGTAGGFGGKKEDTLVFYTFTSFTYAPPIYK